MKSYQFTEKLKKRRWNKFLAFGVPSFGGSTSNHSRKIFGRSRDRTRPVGFAAFRSPFSGNQRHITIFAMGELFNHAIFSFLDFLVVSRTMISVISIRTESFGIKILIKINHAWISGNCFVLITMTSFFFKEPIGALYHGRPRQDIRPNSFWGHRQRFKLWLGRAFDHFR